MPIQLDQMIRLNNITVTKNHVEGNSPADVIWDGTGSRGPWYIREPPDHRVQYTAYATLGFVFSRVVRGGGRR